MSLKAPTHHISALPGDFAKTVLMPGDPLRAKYMAENFLTDAKCINEIRCLYAYTGNYKGKRVSVMASGIGGTSLSTHVYELFELYGVETVIRVGTAGGLDNSLELYDIVIAQGACHDTSYHVQFNLPGTFAPVSDWNLLKRAAETAEAMGVRYRVGNMLSANSFYNDDVDAIGKWARMGALCVDNETSSLYIAAAAAKKKALSLLTVSDHLFKEGKMSALERQDACENMMKIAFEIAEE